MKRLVLAAGSEAVRGLARKPRDRGRDPIPDAERNATRNPAASSRVRDRM
jgi:hypothetical protein